MSINVTEDPKEQTVESVKKMGLGGSRLCCQIHPKAACPDCNYVICTTCIRIDQCSSHQEIRILGQMLYMMIM